MCRAGGEIISSYLTIHGVEPEDFGTYLCLANNGVGSALNMTATLLEGGKKTFVSHKYTS